MLDIHFASIKDIEYIQKVDATNKTRLEKKINLKEILIMTDKEEYIWYLKFSYFWDKIPFMDLVVIEENHRSKWYWSQMIGYREDRMQKEWYKYVMTSTEAWRTAQHFYRKLWYKDIWSLLFSRFVAGEPDQELFLMKTFE